MKENRDVCPGEVVWVEVMVQYEKRHCAGINVERTVAKGDTQVVVQQPPKQNKVRVYTYQDKCHRRSRSLSFARAGTCSPLSAPCLRVVTATNRNIRDD